MQLPERLEYLRTELRAERISYAELAELSSLAEHIEADDTELLEAAGVPEHDETVAVALLDDAGEPIAYLQSSTYDRATLAAIAGDYAARGLYDDRYDPVARICEDHAGQISVFTKLTTQTAWSH